MNFIEISFKILTISIIGFVFAVFSLQISHAFTLSPASGTLLSGSTQTIEIRANKTTVNAATIKLSVTNGTISNYADGTGILGIGECAGGAKTTATTVCVSVAATAGNFTQGQVLGTFTLTKSGSASAVITADSGSQYVDNSAVSGTLGTFIAASAPSTTGGTTTTGTTTTGTTTTGGTLPNTAQTESSQLVMTLGVLIISIGVLLGVTVRVAQKKDQ